MGVILVIPLSISTIQQTVLGQNATTGPSKNNNNNFQTNQNQTTDRPWLGISTILNNMTLAKALGLGETKGFLILDIFPGSPAEKAGLRGGSKLTFIGGHGVKLGGDIILEADGKNVTTNSEFYAFDGKKVGDILKLTILRDNQITEISLKLGVRPEYSIYQNTDYGIKIQYPLDWIKSEENLNPHVVVIFFSPERTSNILFPRAVGQLYITVEFAPNNMTFGEYTNGYIKNTTMNKDYRLINSTATTLAGR
ncbi:MAG: PDZ domain-containing protein [Candidatus Nitrosopolaris sp.]